MTIPSGVWFDFWTDRKYQSLSSEHDESSIQEVKVSLKELPVLVKAGAFIPMAKDMQSTEAYNQSELTVHYYHDLSVSESAYTMYDDGESVDSIERGNYQTINFNAHSDEESLKLDAGVSGSFSGSPKSREITFVVHGVVDPVDDVQVNGSSVSVLNAKAFVKSHQAAYWNEKTQQLRVKARLETHLEVLIK
jgi:oligosaccharide 4-alpha-D-glucosyltransferase